MIPNLLRRSLISLLENHFDIDIEFILNEQINNEDEDSTIIEYLIVPSQFPNSVRFCGSYGIDGDIYGYYSLTFDDNCKLVHSRLGIDIDEARELVLKYYASTPRSWK